MNIDLGENKTSSKRDVCATQRKITLIQAGTEGSDQLVNFCIVISQLGLGVQVGCLQTGDVAVFLGRYDRRWGLDDHVRVIVDVRIDRA